MAQLIPLALTVSCFSKILIYFPFQVLAHPGQLTFLSDIIIITFSPQVQKIPGVENKKKLKASWNGYVSILLSTRKVSWNRIELKRCICTLIR